MPLLIRLPFVAIATFLIVKTKIFKTFSPKKKSISILFTILISLTIISAIPFDYYLFKFNSPSTAIKFSSINQPKHFDVAGIINVGNVGDYVVVDNPTTYDSYYLEKVDNKWRMPKSTSLKVKLSGWKDCFILYKHFIKEGFVAIEIYCPYIDKQPSDYQIRDNKGTSIKTYIRDLKTNNLKNILFYGIYSYDNQPYELYINGELVFSYSENP